MATVPGTEPILTVRGLTARIKEALEGAFPAVWVRGEISGLKLAPSGHLYLTLKDAESQLDVVMWKTAAARLGFQPVDGAEVEAFGDVTVYAPRGRYQLVARELRPAALDMATSSWRPSVSTPPPASSLTAASARADSG